VNDLTKTLIWVGIVAVIFALAWWQGYLVRISNYIQQTREELRKCTWPTWDELKGSTVVVTIAIILLGGFTFVVDYVFYHLVIWISKV
jgi:preprotein translocase subunit SecE